MMEVLRLLAQLWNQGEENPSNQLGLVAIWVIVNHPIFGVSFRQKLDEGLKKTHRAHLTYRVDKDHVGMAVAQRYLDVEAEPNAIQRGEVMIDPTFGVTHLTTIGQLPQEVVTSIQQQTKQFIANELNSDASPIEYAVYVHSLIDSWFDPTLPVAGAPAACRAGCSSCCWTIPDLYPGEEQLILEMIQSLPDQSILKAAIVAAASAMDQAGSAAAAFPLRCPLLGSDHTCRVYQHRPSTCRALASADAEACRKMFQEGDEKTNVPQAARSTMAQVSLGTAWSVMDYEPLPLALRGALMDV